MVGSTRQLSGVDDVGAPALSVFAKRRYRWTQSGLSDPEDVGLTVAPIASAQHPELLAADSDLYPFKPTTDVVVSGAAYPPYSCREFEARVRVGATEKCILVLGQRKLLKNGAFGEARPAEPTLLSYALAFGGTDSAFLGKQGHPLESLRSSLERRELLDANPFAYPRNPCGVGFAMTNTVTEGADELPRLEDPADRLTPDRRVAGPEFRWAGLPVPAGVGWSGLMWFPRCVFFGIVMEVPDLEASAEVRLGVLAKETLAGAPRFSAQDVRHACGASAGLSVKALMGGEAVALSNLSPSDSMREFVVPAPPTRLRIDGRKAGLLDVQPILSTLLIEPEVGTVTVVWRGTGRALRFYTDEELLTMPYEVVW